MQLDRFDRVSDGDPDVDKPCFLPLLRVRAGDTRGGQADVGRLAVDREHLSHLVSHLLGDERVNRAVFVEEVLVDAETLPGAEVVLFGTGLAGEQTVREWGDLTDTLGDEIVTRIARRIPRRYVGSASS